MIKKNLINKCVEVSIQIPYNENAELPYVNPKAFALDVVGSFSKLLIRALEQRLESCANSLRNHVDSVVYNDGYTIIYKRTDGTTHTFNTRSYEIMEEAIETLKNSNYGAFLSDKFAVDQTIKALFWMPKPNDKGRAFKFSDLISELMKALTVGFEL